MSFEDIMIYRDFQVINGYVQIPPNKESDKSRVTVAQALTSISNSQVVRLSQGSGGQTGRNSGQQEWIRLPAITPNTWYNTDPVDDVAGIGA